jgi:hypothetical protein
MEEASRVSNPKADFVSWDRNHWMEGLSFSSLVLAKKVNALVICQVSASAWNMRKAGTPDSKGVTDGEIQETKLALFKTYPKK